MVHHTYQLKANGHVVIKHFHRTAKQDTEELSRLGYRARNIKQKNNSFRAGNQQLGGSQNKYDIKQKLMIEPPY